MVEIGLFENSDGRITCLKLAKRLDDTNSKNPEIRRILSVLEQSKIGDTPTNSEDVLPDKTRLDKIRVEESKDITPVAKAPVKQKRFTPPTVQEVSHQMESKGLPLNEADKEADKFVNFYESKGWMVGRNKMKVWKASVNTWLSNYKPAQSPNQPESTGWSDNMFDDNYLEG